MGFISESSSHTTWTINLQVNSQKLKDYNFGGSGTWENPVGGGLTDFWKQNTAITITSSKDAIPRVFQGYTFDLEVNQQDTIRWVISEMSPLVTENFGVTMYGFKMGSNWDKVLTNPNAQQKELGMLSVIRRFNDPKAPDVDWLKINGGLMTFPSAHVLRGAESNQKVYYYMRLALVDTSDTTAPKVLKFLQIDPTITVK